MSKYIEHLDREWDVLGWPKEPLDPDNIHVPEDEDDPNQDDIQAHIYQSVRKLLETFDEDGHSGMSAPYTINLFKRLALFEPISPLNGNKSEWEQIENGTFQNKRCSHVFKDAEDVIAYDTRGKIFVEPDGVRFASRDSIVEITFPYIPNIEYVQVPHQEEEEEEYTGPSLVV